MNFQDTDDGRKFFQGDGFYISFRPYGTGLFAFSGMDSQTKSGETALCFRDKFYILNGNHTAKYAALEDQSLSSCAAYFLSHGKKISCWSNSPHDLLAELEKLP